MDWDSPAAEDADAALLRAVAAHHEDRVGRPSALWTALASKGCPEPLGMVCA